MTPKHRALNLSVIFASQLKIRFYFEVRAHAKIISFLASLELVTKITLRITPKKVSRFFKVKCVETGWYCVSLVSVNTSRKLIHLMVPEMF